MKYMTPPETVDKLEKLLVKEASAVGKLHERIQLLESELNEMKQLKSAYNSDANAYNSRIKTLQLQIQAKDAELEELQQNQGSTDSGMKALKFELNVIKGKNMSL